MIEICDTVGHEYRQVSVLDDSCRLANLAPKVPTHRRGFFIGGAMALWLKLDTGILNHRKIRLIRNHPEGDSLFTLWVGLLCLGMEQESEALYVAAGVPYRVDDIATTFDLPQKTVELGLILFKNYEMISVLDDGAIFINSLAERQTIEKLTKKREDGRIRQQRFQEKQRLIGTNALLTHCSQQNNEREVEVEVEERSKNKDILSGKPDPIPFKDIIDYFNHKCGTSFRASSKQTQGLIKARWAEGFRVEEFKKAIAWAFFKWAKDAKMVDYLRPATIFTGKMESYIENFKREVGDGGKPRGDVE